MRNLDGTDDEMNGWKEPPPPDRPRILYIKIIMNLKLSIGELQN
jgi:hypothetical protein